MSQLKVVYVSIGDLKPAAYNPRKWSEEQIAGLKESIIRFGMVDPIICNSAPERMHVVIGGHFRLKVAKELGHTEIPVVYLNIPDLEKEKELNIRLNRNLGEFDLGLLKEFDVDFLKSVGFSTEELDDIFDIDLSPEEFNLEKALEKAGVVEVLAKTGDIYEIDGSRLMVGDSMNEGDMFALMDGVKADFCFTDPPYILDHLKENPKKKKGTSQGFGVRKNRGYLGTDSLPDDFTDQWMANVSKVAKSDFSIIVFEHPKNLRTIWTAMEKYWRYRNTLVWHASNRSQGMPSKFKFFNKHDIALVGTEGNVALNHNDEGLFQNEYENALFATSGSPQWEGYEKGKKYQPTDFIEHVTADEKSSGQAVVFGTKPLEILIPYIKVLTKRGGIVLEPFGGSGSTLIASIKMGRKCYLMEKSPIYVEVIKARWERATGKKAVKVN